MTFKDARRECGSIGVNMRRTEDGELRVNLLGAPEAQADYTDDLKDALGTARAMAAWREARR